MTSSPVQSTATALDQAISTYVARKDRAEHPDGEFDNKRRWYPSPTEKRSCCSMVRSPSASYPYSLMLHCRTADHIANLYDVDPAEIRKATRKARPAARLGGTFYKAVARQDDGTLVSLYDGETVYAIGVTLVQRVGKNHGGGYYVRRTVAGARAAGEELGRTLVGEIVILEVECAGQYTEYACDCRQCEESRYGYFLAPKPVDHGKLAFSRVTPIAIVQEESRV